MNATPNEDEELLPGYTIYWRIENFNPIPNDCFRLISPACNIAPLKTNWKIKINKRGNFIAAFLFKEPQLKYLNVTFSVSLLTGAGWIPFQDSTKVTFGGNSNTWGVNQLINVEKLKEEEWFYLPNGTLTVSFRIWNNKIKNMSAQYLITTRLRNEHEVEQRIDRPVEKFFNLKPSQFLSFPISYKFHTQEKEEKTNTAQATKQELNSEDDLLRMFKEKKFSFVTLKTATKEFSVHKAVVCSKSPVFDAMFERKMKEKDCNVVDIDDVDSETMTSLIKFLHFEPLGYISWESATLLYYAADKYDIDSLRKACVLLLEKQLSKENICDTFVLANMHQDTDLMNCAEDYFCTNSKQILLSKNWRNFLLSYTELAAEVLCKLAGKI